MPAHTGLSAKRDGKFTHRTWLLPREQVASGPPQWAHHRPDFPVRAALFASGAGEQHFNMVQSAIGKALEAKHPRRDHTDDEPVRPRPKRGVTTVYAAGGYTEAIDDRKDDDFGDDS
jgi:hypothetical protein